MGFTIPSLDELHARMVADFGNRFPGLDVSRGSDDWIRLRVLAGGILSLHYHNARSLDDALPDKAAGAALVGWGTAIGVAKKGATAARKADALRLVGTAASAFTEGEQLVHQPSGTIFELGESGTIPGGGFIDVDVVAVTLGSVGKLQSGEVLTFLTPPSGINADAELQLDIDEDGTDEEADGPYRTRILEKLASPGMGGNAHDYKAWAEEVAGVASAYVFPLRQGLGSVDIAALHAGSGSVRHLTSDERIALKAYIDAKRPVSVADFRVLTTTGVVGNVEVLVQAQEDLQWAFDWTDDPAPTVVAWTAGTRTLQMSTRPGDLGVGDRVIIGGAGSKGEENVVEALSGGDSVVLATVPAGSVSGGYPIYSGGPLVKPIRDAIIAHIDSLGPSRGVFAAGLWEGSLRKSTLFRIAQLTDGVLDSSILVPSGNVDGVNTAPEETITVYIPDRTVVRRWWP